MFVQVHIYANPCNGEWIMDILRNKGASIMLIIWREYQTQVYVFVWLSESSVCYGFVPDSLITYEGVRSLTATRSDADIITVTWEPPHHRPEKVTSYLVEGHTIQSSIKMTRTKFLGYTFKQDSLGFNEDRIYEISVTAYRGGIKCNPSMINLSCLRSQEPTQRKRRGQGSLDKCLPTRPLNCKETLKDSGMLFLLLLFCFKKCISWIYTTIVLAIMCWVLKTYLQKKMFKRKEILEENSLTILFFWTCAMSKTLRVLAV